MFKYLFCSTLLAFSCLIPVSAQKKYQSLMWEIHGPGMEKPSYLYGTMHVSGKMVFHLGDQFYNAIEKVDVVALELEPEAWLQAIFDDKESRWYSRGAGSWNEEYGWGESYDRTVPPLRDNFIIRSEISERVQYAMMYDPSLLNYMLFRYDNYGASADFEEDTWLDMYIYQTGKKMGKETLGLETYEQSGNFMKLARKEERMMKKKKKKSFDERDRREMNEMQDQLEPAYRRQDLDLIDSLNKLTTSEAFDKYILVERNKVFVERMDSVMKSGRTMFAGMGCAHLPGTNGVIEMLRARGYKVEPISKGERDAKRREKLENTIYKREYKPFTTKDGQLSFVTPSPVYDLGAGDNGSSVISLDIPNGSSFIVYRMKTHAGLKGLSDEDIMLSIDSILYEAVAGDIISQKRIKVQGYNALDIMNRTRRGDFQRKQLIILPEEILLLKLTATGNKVKNGYGDPFFNSLKINIPAAGDFTPWTSQDGSLKMSLPGHIAYYNRNLEQPVSSDFEVNSYVPDKKEYYTAQRYSIYNPGFMDEDIYEANRLTDAFQEDNKLKEVNRRYLLYKGYPAVRAHSRTSQNKDVYTLSVIQNLNYCVFSAFVSDSLRAEKFLNSIEFTTPVYTNWQEFADTTNHFKVMLPYEQMQEKEDDEYDWGWYGGDEEQNEYEGDRGGNYLAPHGSPDAVSIQWQRMDKYEWIKDTTDVFEDIYENYIEESAYTLINADTIWNDQGFVLNLAYGDTSCTRREMARIQIYNHTRYDLLASYDSVAGPSQFVKRVFETFVPTDTVFATSAFVSPNQQLLEDLFSADSTTQANAIGIITSTRFEEKDVKVIREKYWNRIEEIKDDEKKKAVRAKLTYALWRDTTDENIRFISDEFYKWADTANYQMVLLNQLKNMDTKAGVLAYKKLLLDEPPIVASSSSYDYDDMDSYTSFSDSLELNVHLFPEYLQLIALNEYESRVYGLTSTLIDSSLIKKNVYEKQLGQIMLEAKNELKRLNSSDEETYRFNTWDMMNYLSLLHPYRDRPEVKAIFDKAFRTKKTKLLMDLAAFELQHDVKVADSVFTRIVANEKRVIPLYNMLREEEALNQFPKEYNDRERMLELYIRNKFADKYDKTTGKVDSVLKITSRLEKIKGKEFDLYYYKYKAGNTDQWKGVLFAFERTDKNEVWPQFIERTVTIVLDKDEDELEEMDKEYKRMVEACRRKFRFTDGENYSNNNWY